MARKPKLPRAADFFGGSVSGGAESAERKTVKPQNRKNADGVGSAVPATEGSAAHTIETGFTEKVTFYLSRELLKRLELTKVELLLEHDLKVSRSQIVEVILEEMVGDTSRIGSLLDTASER